MREESVEIVEGSSHAPAVVSCEHASERLPAPWSWPEPDAWLRGTHWAYDPGAAELAREVAAAMGAAAVLSRFSRLLADPNREEHDAELFRVRAEGRDVHLNRGIDAGDRERRLAHWRAYHDALGARIRAATAPIVLSMHTFTPVYEGTVRELEVGVLFDAEEELAGRVGEAIAAAGFVVRMNEPYSGRGGLIYSAERHARAHGRRALELEVRQDLAVKADVRARVVAAVSAVLLRDHAA